MGELLSMAKTANFALPLLAPAQAQKHVTVNEALVRLDAITQLRIQASDLDVPPTTAENGASYIVPATATNEWAGRGGQVAVWSNGGWAFLEPVAGWRAWHLGQATTLVHDGAGWISGGVAISLNGACTTQEIIEFDQVVPAGVSFEISGAIPGSSLVSGVTARVLSVISGTLASWRVGVPGADDRFGTGLGIDENSFLLGLAGSPTAYYDDTPLRISAEAGAFAGGAVRFAIHLSRLTPPRIT